MTPTNTPVPLACGHNKTFPPGYRPARADPVWCARCDTYTTAQPRKTKANQPKGTQQ